MRRLNGIRFLLAAAGTAYLIGAGACSDSTSPPPPPPPAPPDTSLTEYTYNTLNTYSHDGTAFTQGLVYVDSVFFEGTGIRTRSTLREVEVETGAVIRSHSLADTLFGEGVAVWGDTIVQLTWQSYLAIIYDKDTFNEIGRFNYPTEGWGLTHDGTRFIMSDGTDTLYFRDKNTFAEIGRVAVFDSTGPVDRLNELEYIDGYVYANRWYTNWIDIIDPETGRVRGRIDLSGMEVPRPPGGSVANGIAYDAQNDRLFVTGKYWRHLYHIELIEKTDG
jgi:glutamine cyclotransferase